MVGRRAVFRACSGSVRFFLVWWDGREPVFLNDAQVVKELFKRVGLAVLGACSARVARAVDHGVVGQCGARVPVGACGGGEGFHHDGAGDAWVCACVQEEP